MDQGRVETPQRLVVEPEAGKPTDPVVLDKDVATFDEATQDRRAIRRLQVEAEASLVAVDREVVGRGAVRRRLADPGRSPATRGVALRWFDLDHIRPQVAEQHRAVRPGEHGRAVDDAQTVQRPRDRARVTGRFGRGDGIAAGW